MGERVWIERVGQVEGYIRYVKRFLAQGVLLWPCARAWLGWILPIERRCVPGSIHLSNRYSSSSASSSRTVACRSHARPRACAASTASSGREAAAAAIEGPNTSWYQRELAMCG